MCLGPDKRYVSTSRLDLQPSAPSELNMARYPTTRLPESLLHEMPVAYVACVLTLFSAIDVTMRRPTRVGDTSRVNLTLSALDARTRSTRTRTRAHSLNVCIYQLFLRSLRDRCCGPL